MISLTWNELQAGRISGDADREIASDFIASDFQE